MAITTVSKQDSLYNDLVYSLPKRFPRALKGCTAVRMSFDHDSGSHVFEFRYGDDTTEILRLIDPMRVMDLLQEREIARRPREAWEFHH